MTSIPRRLVVLAVGFVVLLWTPHVQSSSVHNDDYDYDEPSSPPPPSSSIYLFLGCHGNGENHNANESSDKGTAKQNHARHEGRERK
mmetsp:Transcript_919/g.1839  ORF Transcript_919/g.1839 Transcript_919/m.1839 type:complete len:87 (-) Transcript_919:803-1063(-)